MRYTLSRSQNRERRWIDLGVSLLGFGAILARFSCFVLVSLLLTALRLFVIFCLIVTRKVIEILIH
ncbi:hypothetical protein J7K28_02030 [Candidatus Aerophobetes bacterium]|nr:hypothetical protein [Candidatus Aerophobetes bacterium]